MAMWKRSRGYKYDATIKDKAYNGDRYPECEKEYYLGDWCECNKERGQQLVSEWFGINEGLTPCTVTKQLTILDTKPYY